MKILYLSDHGPYSSTFIRQDVESMAKFHDVFYIAFITDKDYEGKQVKSKIVLFPENSFKSKIIWRLEEYGIYTNWYNKKFSLELNAEIQKFAPDIIHCQFAYEALKYFDNCNFECPVFVNFRGYDASIKLKNRAYRNKIKSILSQKNVFPIFVCEALKNMLTKNGIPVRNEHLILYTGVDITKFNRSEYVKPNHPKFIQVGQFNDKKGHIITIKAFEKFRKQYNQENAELIFIGDGKNLNSVKAFVDEIGLSKHIHFLGKKSQSEIICELNNASVFVHHSIVSKDGDMEGIPNAVIEAMAMELPILSTNHSGIPEAVDHGIHGLLCNENDIETYVSQIGEIINWPYLKQNKSRVAEKFEINEHLNQLNAFYYSQVASVK